MIAFNISRALFRETYFEQQPKLWRQCFDASFFGWETIDRALDQQDPTPELLKVLKKGRVDPAEYVEEYIDVGLRRRRVLKNRLYEMLQAGGATIVLNRIELVSTVVRDVCMEVGRLVGAQTTANAYASFGVEAATNVHWDTHDVFVVQIEGRKHWRLYEPTHLLPISSQVSNDRKSEVPSQPLFDEVLNAGDVLYVPRGWWHRVMPVEGSDTIHLTVAVHTPLVLDYLVWACAAVLPNLLEVRHSLIGEADDPTRIGNAVGAVSEMLRHPATLEAFYARSQRRERVVTPFNIAALLKKPDSSLPAGTRVMLNTRHSADWTVCRSINGESIDASGERLLLLETLSNVISLDIDALHGLTPMLTRHAFEATLRELAKADLIAIMLPDATAVTGESLGAAVECD